MLDLERLFTNVYDSVSTKSNQGFTDSFESRNILSSNESKSLMPIGPQKEFEIQKNIRPIFGKCGINDTEIGTHPDFIDLESSSSTVNHYSCTLFVDIKGSTRLSLLMTLEEVFQFKNSVIKTCIETIRSFDGHVHRIMGDAVMAFFCGKNISKEDSIANALNCITTMKLLLENGIQPWLQKQGWNAAEFGFRIGCDFGNDQEVLWGSYGYQNVGEVSATGLPVDMASKLQSLAGKNKIMLGQGFLDFVDWPKEFSTVKTKIKGGSLEDQLIVKPNLTKSDGTSLNYTMRLLDYDKFMEVIALPTNIKRLVLGSKVIDNSSVEFQCFEKRDEQLTEYISASRFLEKNVDLQFKLTAKANTGLKFPLTAIFVKTNHGSETPEVERGVEQPRDKWTMNKKSVSEYNKSNELASVIEFPESTQYRGLHTMKCAIFDTHNIVVFCDWIGVLIK